MVQMAPKRPPDPWEKYKKDAEANWKAALQNLSLPGETLRDPEGDAPARHCLQAAIYHLHAYRRPKEDQVRTIIAGLRGLEQEKRPLPLCGDDDEYR